MYMFYYICYWKRMVLESACLCTLKLFLRYWRWSIDGWQTCLLQFDLFIMNQVSLYGVYMVHQTLN